MSNKIKDAYWRKVRRLTEQAVRENSEKIENSKRLPLRGEDWHLDHKKSISEGWKDKTPAEKIADPKNLQVIRAKKNLKKSNS